MRVAILAVAALVPSVALASDDLRPTFDSGWQYVLKEPAGPAQERYGIVDAEPGRSARWTVRVECGVRDTRTGRVIRRVVGTGESTRGRAPGFGGRWDLSDGRCGNFVVSQDRARPEDLRLVGEMVGVNECPRRGMGELSTGD
ncbi:hypothetical protein [Methylobacterium gnaphalii]|uniref:DUF3617 domain-containing protein n=1 Tax=Methylobacterium gnaphalii TaxID=1010610 RepID=A0A512JG28_9HYPH|nr:hypothetical protein [Methylobacterium gnaphalii]GEP08898.1 hypothetical protein MGN01_07430 [Methylobacterium gnaphalii]GJD70664.1 hypothetical protein MMMDOFMJ_3616 [Methylobacterium gnaphalii]GLS50456.1 hypothetical protein GCM10007885_33080 [Methylobacterium gnaphalii]